MTTKFHLQKLVLLVFAAEGFWNVTALVNPKLQSEQQYSMAGQTLVVKTPMGPVRGKSLNGTWVWRGIPFAKPPVNDLRFSPH